MNFYKVEVGILNGNPWYATLPNHVNNEFGVLKSLNEGILPELNKPINFNLIDVRSESKEFCFNDDVDMIYWKDDILTDSIIPDRSKGSYFIISENIKNVLIDFKMPDTFLIPISFASSFNNTYSKQN